MRQFRLPSFSIVRIVRPHKPNSNIYFNIYRFRCQLAFSMCYYWTFFCVSVCVCVWERDEKQTETNKQVTFPKRMNLPRTRIQPPVVVVGKCNLMRLRLRRLLSKLKISSYLSSFLYSPFISLLFSSVSLSKFPTRQREV